MDKARLECVLSGSNQHALTKSESHFLQTVLADFDKKQARTEYQEDRLESLYKEKSQSIPDKNHFALKERSVKRAKTRRPTGKYY